FSIGTTTVLCSASDTSGNAASGSFDVVVRDTTAPVLTLPADLAIDATATTGATVDFTATALDIVDGTRTVNCAPVSGSTFAIGVSTVTCTAADIRGNGSSGRFNVTVNRLHTSLVTAPVSGTFGGRVKLSATLTAASSGVTGRTLEFLLNGSSVGLAVTNSDGVAQLDGVALGA